MLPEQLCRRLVSVKQTEDEDLEVNTVTGVPLCSQCCENAAVLGP